MTDAIASCFGTAEWSVLCLMACYAEGTCETVGSSLNTPGQWLVDWKETVEVGMYHNATRNET